MYSSFYSTFEQSGMSGSPGEPMAIGSPGGSSPRGQILPPTEGGVYLPGYLLGDTTSTGSATPSRIWPRTSTLSPTKSRYSIPASSPTSPNRSILTPVSQVSLPSAFSRSFQGRAGSEKHGGPPVQGLFDVMGTPSPALSVPALGTSTPLQSLTPQTRLSHLSRIGSGIQTESQLKGKIPHSPAQLDPFYSQGEALSADEVLDESRVTVFGFPPAASSYILQQFSQYGSIVEHKMSNCGNWMHIHYQSKLQAKKALSKNGKVYAGSIMVGVSHCIDKSAMALSPIKENVSMLDTPGRDRSNVSLSVDRSLNNSSRMRSLTQAYKMSASEHEVLPVGGMPKKTTGVVSKAMEYVFGW